MKKFRVIYIFIFTFFITLTIIKCFFSFVTYKNTLNINIYNTIMRIQSHSNSIVYYNTELLNERYSEYNLINAHLNYNEVLQDIQQLNIMAVRFNNGTGIDISKINNINTTINFNDLEQRQHIVLSEEEFISLNEANKIFIKLSNIIDRNLKEISKDSWNNPNIFKNKTWTKIINDFNE